MATKSSTGSPSPIPFRQNPNPNSANSKKLMEKRGDANLRTSANGSPFPKPSLTAHPSAWCSNSKTTPANSPSEVGRRNSFSREINEHKENKKLNPNPNPTKGTKNFMSPTFSAVSKANLSSRKKVLAERNESVRTSGSLSDGKFLLFPSAGDDELKSETENCEFQEEFYKKEVTSFSCEAKKRVTFDDDVVVLSPEVTSYDVDEAIKPIDFAESEEKETSSFVSSPFSSVVPLDADPCVLPSYESKADYLSPYDPKTNYLVPRPQFLRYNPEKVPLHIKNLEDMLSSETSSDDDVESTTEEAEREEKKISHSSSPVNLESFDESVQAHAEDEVSIEESDEEVCVGSESVKQSRFFRRWRMVIWVLFGVVAILSSLIASHAPPESVLSKVHEFNHADFRSSLHRMKKWSTTYVPLMISSFSETDDELTPLELLNFSALVCNANDHFVDRGGKVEILKEKGRLEEVVKKMDSEFEETAPGILLNQQVHYIEQTEEVELGYSENLEEDKFPEEVEVNHDEVEIQNNPQSEEAVDESVLEPVAALPEEQNNPQSEEFELTKPVDESVLEPVAAFPEEQSNPQSEESELSKLVNEPELVPAASQHQIPFIEHIENEKEVGLEPGAVQVPMEGQGAVMLLVASLCVATVFGAFAMFSKHMKKAGTSSISTQQAEAPSKPKKKDSFRLEADTYSPSEMNSYSYTGYESETQSKEKERKQTRRNYKRDSFASSSSESYGSFTTYSTMPAKHGDEVVTPVRRSSRINKGQPPLAAARRGAINLASMD